MYVIETTLQEHHKLFNLKLGAGHLRNKIPVVIPVRKMKSLSDKSYRKP